MIILISICLGLFSGAQPVQAATKTNPQQVAQALKAKHFTGTVLIIRHGKTILRRSYGYANFAHLQRNTPATVYQLASVQKVLTAVLLMQLVQANKVQLNEPLSHYYPQIAHSKQITLRQMLDMNSGLYSTTDPQKMLSDRQIVDFAAKHVKVGQIGAHNYEPVNYTLLTGIIERLTQQSYHQLVQQKILQPLKLRHTGFMLDDFTQ
ncbi:serine hydrolase domain-containing protein [Loigolactobacillus jiayinensis]|uniref:Serine hydrolase domain-containing protein n=1 Tax=Loigolactobacillus jiayinensis TaxID=2486016 RepID=A0ABW1REY6_9LACO|nr:serine hydrolase domain-containing protein [Loigolactobacillus jiayinensis]